MINLKVKSPVEETMESEVGSDEEYEENSVDESDTEMKDLLSDDSNDISEDESIHSSDSDDLEDANDNQVTKLLENPGWADAMSKILKSNKPKRKKTIVLAKAKKINDNKTTGENEVKEKLGFEIVKADGDVEEDIKQEKEIKVEKSESKPVITVAQRRLLKKAWQSKGRVKPNVLDKDREKALSKIATRGVITLFNTVRQQQKTLNEKLQEAGSLEVKRSKALKSLDKKQFLNSLAERAKCENVDNPVKSESEGEEERADSAKLTSQSSSKTEKSWNVLRNNFIMGASMKDWDKEEKEEEDSTKDRKKKNVQSKTDKTSSKKKKESKFSFSMDVDADYEDEQDFGDEGSGEDDSGGDSDFSD